MKTISGEERRKKIIQWLNDKIGKPLICEACGKQEWGLERDLSTPILIEDEKVMLGGKTFPQIMLVCSNCGNVKYFSAIKLGIVSQSEEPSNEK